MIDRLKKLLSGMFSKGMSKLETPEILAEQAQEELESNLAKVREGVAASLANEKQLEVQIKKKAEEVETWGQRAAVAVGQNNEDVARQCLVKKDESKRASQDLSSQLEAQKTTTASLKDKYGEMQGVLREFQTKKSTMLSRAKASEATTNAQELMAGAGSGGGMDKWEEKIRMKEAKSEANRQLTEEDMAGRKVTEALAKTDLDSELAALKEQMAAAGQQPKLIVDKSAEKPADPPASGS